MVPVEGVHAALGDAERRHRALRERAHENVRPAASRPKPSYPVESVDNALRLLQMLRDLGEVRVTPAARELNVSPSTVHRLMAMLVYRGFAVQDESRVYLPGPAVGVAPAAMEGVETLVHLARTHIEQLRDHTRGTAGLTMLTGRVVRLLYTAGARDACGGADRRGLVFPAYNSAGGRAILSSLPDRVVASLYTAGDVDDGLGLSDAALETLLARLRLARLRGYATTMEEAERGIATVAAPIRLPFMRPLAAVALSAPAPLADRITNSHAVEQLLTTRDLIEHDLHHTRA